MQSYLMLAIMLFASLFVVYYYKYCRLLKTNEGLLRKLDHFEKLYPNRYKIGAVGQKHSTKQ